MKSKENGGLTMRHCKWQQGFKKSASVVLACSLVLGLSVSSGDAAQAAKKPKLSSSKVTVSVGQTKIVKVKQTNKKVKWSVKKGKQCVTLTKMKKTSVGIKGKKAGTATVQAAVSGKKLTCKVTVKRGKTICPPNTSTASPTPTAVSQATATPTTVPSTNPSATPTTVPSASPSLTPTEQPTATPEALPEGVYEGTDISWIDPSKPMVAFTFDDGPIGNADTDNSMVIHKALKEHGAHATFFYIGSRTENNDKAKDEIKQAAEAGFEVGNHSWAWSSLDKLAEDKVKESIDKTNAVLTEATGYKNFLFRAPNLATSATMRECINAPFVHCGVDSKDWDKATTEKIIENVKKAKDGDIILMHETENNTVEAVPVLLDYFKEQGWQVVSVSELFLARGQKMTPGQDHHSCPPAE